jgi:hypothetical protein
MHINEASAPRITPIPRQPGFMLPDYTHLRKTICARQRRPHTKVPEPSQSITPVGANTRLKPYSAKEHAIELNFTTTEFNMELGLPEC